MRYIYKSFFKRLLDIVLSLCGIVILSPVYLVVALVIVINDPGPVLFKQKRVGKNKKLFWLYKFRSMKMATPHDVPTHQLKNPEQYLLKCGRFLRKYSLDELPQLFNIIKGDMSIIGPRPALWNQNDLIEERDKFKANNIKPGLTGLAQINGRDELPIIDKARYDGEYANNINFLSDMKIFFSSVIKVLKKEGLKEGSK